MRENVLREMEIAVMKKLLCFMVVLLLVAQIPVFAFADGEPTYEEGTQQYVETAKDLEVRMAREREIAVCTFLRYDPDNVYYTLAVPVYEQINGWYCGPATVKQVVQYVKGSSKTQEQYAQLLGTTTAGTNMTNISGIMNNEIGNRWDYLYAQIGSYGNWTSKIIYCASCGIPVVLDINTTGVPAIPYNSTGHYVNTSGVNFRVLTGRIVRKVRITDPYGPGLGNIWYKAADLYTANNAHYRHAFIY